MTDLIETIRRTLVPIHKEGYPFLLIGIVLTVLAGYFSQFFGWIFLILTLWVCYFFRDPERATPVADGLVVSPADGRVNLIATVLPPPELDLPQVPGERTELRVRRRGLAPADGEGRQPPRVERARPRARLRLAAEPGVRRASGKGCRGGDQLYRDVPARGHLPDGPPLYPRLRGGG